MENNSNTSTQPETPPAATGPNVAELQAQLEEGKKQREGLLRDLQQERSKRQELETKLTPPAPSAANPDVKDDELGQVLKPYIEPVAKKAAAAEKELENLRLEKAQNFLTGKLGKSWESIEADRDFQDKMTQVIRKYGVTGNVYDMTVRAYELLQLESVRVKEEERARAAAASSTASIPPGTGAVSTTSAKKYTAHEFDKLHPKEFGALSQKGDFRKLPDGSFEYIPR